MAIEVVPRDEVLQRDGDRFVEAAGLGRAEHRDLREGSREGRTSGVPACSQARESVRTGLPTHPRGCSVVPNRTTERRRTKARCRVPPKGDPDASSTRARHRAARRRLARPGHGLAQDATPVGSPAGGTCVAPDLPPGTPTPQEAPPDAAASPAGEPPAAEGGFPAPTPPPVGTPADAATTEKVLAGFANLGACFATDMAGFAALATPNFVAFVTGGSTNPYDLVAALEGEPPGETVSVGEVLVYADGRYSVDVVEQTGYQLDHNRWYLVEEDGYLKIDALEFGLPLAVAGPSTLVEVGLFDYAFGPSTYDVALAETVIFRATNRGTEPHVIFVVQYPAGTTAEQVIAGEVDALEDIAVPYGGHFLLPGQTAEFGLVGLEPGVYFLVCDVTTATGTPHYHLGMVAQITVA